MGTIYAEPFIIPSAVLVILDFIVIISIVLLYRRGKKNIAYVLICLLIPLIIVSIFLLYLALLGYGGLFNPYSI